MKKFLAVLLAALMVFSVMAVGVVAASGEITTTSTADDGGNKTKLPTWLTELIARIKQVIAKLLLKLGIKFSWFDKIAA